MELFNAWELNGPPFETKNQKIQRLVKHRGLAKRGMKNVITGAGMSFPIYIPSLEKEFIVEEMDYQLSKMGYRAFDY